MEKELKREPESPQNTRAHVLFAMYATAWFRKGGRRVIVRGDDARASVDQRGNQLHKSQTAARKKGYLETRPPTQMPAL